MDSGGSLLSFGSCGCVSFQGVSYKIQGENYRKSMFVMLILAYFLQLKRVAGILPLSIERPFLDE